VLVVPISTSLHWDRATVSGAYAVSLVVAGVLGVPIGPLLDRFGARFLMSCGSVLGGLSLIGLAQMQTIWQFYLFWSGGLGLAMALTLYPVTFTVVANWFVRKRRAALAVLTLVGGLSSPLLSVFLSLECWSPISAGVPRLWHGQVRNWCSHCPCTLLY
jgi:MFS family permease